MRVDITLLGRFGVTIDGDPVPDEGWRRRQAATIVKLLALAPNRRLHREQVIDALWPDLGIDEAAPRLHKSAHFARKVCDAKDAVVLADETLSLFPDSDVHIDAVAFDKAASEAEQEGTAEAAAAALALHTGDLLPDDLYEPWGDEPRERLRALRYGLLRQAERWDELLACDPADEEAHVALMRNYRDAGDRRAALRQFERMDRALRRELGVGPTREAVELRDELLASGVETLAEPAGTALVGRTSELDQLRHALAEAEGGRGTSLLISGPAGVGKSAMVDRIRRGAADDGWKVGTGMAAAFEGAWPYAPVMEAVAELVRADPSLLDELDPAVRGEIDRALSGAALDWSGESGDQRLFVATSEVVRLAAASTSVLLVIEDLHEAHEASLRLIHYLARSIRELPVALLLTLRPAPISPALAEVRASLGKRHGAIDLPLSALDRSATAELVREYSGHATETTIDQVWALSDGVPFAIVELASRLGADEPLGATNVGVLSGLTDSSLDVLRSVAVLGPTFDTDQFVAVSGLEENEAFAHLDTALAARVIAVSDLGYRFRHDLIRQALLEGLTPHLRRAAHRDAARKLDVLGASAAQVAHHLIQAGDIAAAVPAALQAADTEAALGAFREALDLVDSVREHAKGDDLSQALSLRADLLAAMGDVGAVPAYRQAIDTVAPAQARRLRARLARAALMAGEMSVAEQALAGLELDGGPDDGAILIARGNLHYFQGDVDAAWNATEEARTRIGQGQQSWELLDLIALQGLIAHNRGQWYERLRFELSTTRESHELAVSVFDSHLCVAEYLLYGPMAYPEVIELADALRRTAQGAGAARAVAFADALAGEAALLSGDLDTAERRLTESLELHRELGAQAGESLSLERLAEVCLERGQRDKAVRLLRDALTRARWSMASSHLLQRIHGTLIRAASDAVEARELVDQAEATFATEDRCNICQIMFSVPATIACADVGDLDEAHRHLAAAEQSASIWEGTAWQAAILEARSHLALAAGDPSEARSSTARAAEVFESSGQPLDAARCRAWGQTVGHDDTGASRNHSVAHQAR
jgi:DNA-binding SARP family transcriptional activator